MMMKKQKKKDKNKTKNWVDDDDADDDVSRIGILSAPKHAAECIEELGPEMSRIGILSPRRPGFA